MHIQPLLPILCVKAVLRRSIHLNLNGKGQVVVKAKKQGLDFTNVRLRVVASDGSVLMEAKGKAMGNGTWNFHCEGQPPRLTEVSLQVEAEDRVGHSVIRYYEAA